MMHHFILEEHESKQPQTHQKNEGRNTIQH